MQKVIEINDHGFEHEVVQAGIPVVVDFWAPWCGPCRMVGPAMEELANEYAGKIKFTKLNLESNTQVATAMGIRSIPTVMLFDGSNVVDAMIGARPKQAFMKMFDRYLKKYEKSKKKISK